MKRLLLFIFLIGSCQGVLGQTGLNTQRKFTPLLLNPASPSAQTDRKLMLHYKRQELSAGRMMENTLITGLYPLFKEKGGPSLAIGFSFLNEQEGGNAGLNRQSFDLALAYPLVLPNEQYLALGLQTAYRQIGLRTGGFTTGSQWEENVGYNPALPLGEVFLEERPGYLDLGAGAEWFALNPKGQKKFFLAVSAYRINRPSYSIMAQDRLENLPMTWLVQGGYTVWANETFALMPNGYYQQDGQTELYNAGMTLRYHFENENPFDPIQTGSMSLTSMIDQNGSLRFGLLFEQPQYEIGLAYDFNAGSFGQATQSRNATELAVSVRKSLFKPKVKRIKVDRYFTGSERVFDLEEVKVLEDQEEKQPSGKDLTLEELKAAEDDGKKEEKFQLALRKDFSFGFNQVTLTESAKTYLEDIYLLMNQNDELKLQVIGHTDNVGRKSTNYKVSLSRAQAVIDYLAQRGVDPERMQAIGMGDQEPLAENDTEMNRAKNRRVEFILYQE